jgi:hypothetical protein
MVAASALALLSLTLGGCSISLSDLPLGGSSADAPHANDQAEFPAVNDLPQGREDAAMEPAERARVEKELIEARNRQASSDAAVRNAAAGR